MTEYERPSFNQEWWDEVEQFLEDNPQVGFNSEDTKQFIKFCVNRKMQEIEEDLEQLRELAKELDSE